jgi:hypothetical protein
MFTFDENTDLVELYFDHVTMDEDEEYVPKGHIEDPLKRRIVKHLCYVLNDIQLSHGDNGIDGFKDGPDGDSGLYDLVRLQVAISLDDSEEISND